MSDTHDALDAAIRDHLADEHGSLIVTKWLLIAEMMERDADFQKLATIASDNLSMWDAAGMAGFAEHAAKHDYATAGDE